MSTVALALASATARLAAEGIEDARLEAEVLLAFVMSVNRARLVARLQDSLDPEVSCEFDKIVDRRVLTQVPIAYIIGTREFYGLEITCASGALIPRPETEMLVDIALAELRRREGDLRIADVGTGTGAIAVAIAVHSPGARITAIDSSPHALSIARENAERHGVACRIDFLEQDLFSGAGEFDLILANLPYVSAVDWAGLPAGIREHEPREALVGGRRGTEAIERLLQRAPAHLALGGLVAVEIGESQAEVVFAIARSSFPDADVCVKKDLAGLDRVVVVRTGRIG